MTNVISTGVTVSPYDALEKKFLMPISLTADIAVTLGFTKL